MGVKVEDKQQLERAENAMVRWMCGVTIKDRISTVKLREHLGICSATNFVRKGRLGWFGHVERKSDDDWVKTWEQCVNEDMKELGLKREETLDRNTWYSKVFGESVLSKHARKCRC